MDHGTGGAVLLRNTLALLPTHLVVVNLDERLQDDLEEMAAFLPALGVSILHVHRGGHATVPVGELNEAQVLRMLPDAAAPDLDDPYVWAEAEYRYHRPAALHALRAAFKSWSDERGQERTVLLFAGAPRTPLEAVLLGELPLDAEALFHRRTGALPLVLRFLVAPRRPFEGDDDLPLAHLLALLEETYFALPPFAPERPAPPGAPAASPFDTTVWVDGAEGSELVHFLRALLRLHGRENERLAANAPAVPGAERPPVSPLDSAMRAEGEHRLVDWLSLCATEHAPRLWTGGLPALAAVLDMEHERRRRAEPLASIGRYERERDWEASPLVRSYLDGRERPARGGLAGADFPYRITDEDGASKLELSRYLSDAGEFGRAAELAAELLEDDPHNRVLNRLLGADLWVAGHRARAGEVLRRCIALTEIDPALDEAERADEIATLHHLMNDYDAALSGYERAIAADPLNAHAYEGLVLILRARGETALADHWLQAARRRDLALPLVAVEERLEGAFEPEPAAGGETGGGEAARERRSRWWSFLRR